MPEVSIIVPVYNTEKYLNRCVDSILAQTFSDFEIILVDDGSTDSSFQICSEYATLDTRIKVIRKANEGPSAARNEGIRFSVGEYLMFCDSDDCVAPTWCEVMYHAIIRHPRAFIATDIMYACAEDCIPVQAESSSSGEVFETYFCLYKRGLTAYTVNKIYDSSIIKKNGIVFDINCRFSEDVVFNATYCTFCERIVYIPQKLYYYINNNGSLMNRYYGDLFSKHLLPFWGRLKLIQEDELEEYCDIWLYQFIHLFDNVFDSRNKASFFQKMMYNQRMMSTKEFRYCLAHASGKKESPLAMCILKMHNYYIYWMFEKMVQFKQMLRRKKQ